MLRADTGAGEPPVVHGADAIARRALMFAGPERVVTFATVNSEPGAIITIDDAVVSLMEFAIAGARIIGINSLADPTRLAPLHIHRV